MARSIIPHMLPILATVPIVKVIIILAVIGFILYLIFTYVPMPAPIKNIILVVAVVAIILWLLQIFGLMNL